MKKKKDTTLPSELMVKPALSWNEFWTGILGLPHSTAEVIAKGNNPPKFFLLGRRRYIRTLDAIDWINSVASSKRYFPRRNRSCTTKIA